MLPPLPLLVGMGTGQLVHRLVQLLNVRMNLLLGQKRLPSLLLVVL